MSSVPFVSCICITRNRRVFLRQAVHYFHRAAAHYSYTVGGRVELIVLDSSDEPCLVPERSHWDRYVKYYPRKEERQETGMAHNVACELTEGDIIIQWDDDDWHHPERIFRQVQTLLTAPGDAFAYTSRFYWYHVERRQACMAKSWDGGGSMGATFAYWKETWKKTPFRDVPGGEDVPFQKDLADRGCPMLDAKDPEFVVYMRHNQNGSALTQYAWTPEATQAARHIMGFTDCDFYDGLAELMPVANWNHPNGPGSKMHIMNPTQQLWARHFR